MIDWTEIIIALCSLVITGILIPVITAKRQELKGKLTKEQWETVEYWVDAGVRWAKQWLYDETGAFKKAQVMDFVDKKLTELGIEVSVDDLSILIESVYERVKKEEQ